MKKTAVVALTPGGSRLARAVASHLKDADLFLPDRLRVKNQCDANYFQPPLSSLIPRLFEGYGRLVFFCALGAAVRLAAPLLKGKNEDPAVVVVDEKGWNVISLLSGHSGGANRLALELAEFLGANPVITTASDLNGIPALDELCRGKGWKIENPHLLAPLTSAMLEGERVAICSDGELGPEEDLGGDAANFRFLPMEEWKVIPKDIWKVVITDRLFSDGGMPKKTLVVRPRKLVAGLGFHRGADASLLWECLAVVLRRAGLSASGIGTVATIDRRGNEKGVRELADRLGADLILYSARELECIASPSPPSDSAVRWAGVSGVCERAALAAAAGGRLLVPKTRFPEVTVAVAEKPRPSKARKGKLFLVGIGPGDPDLIPPRARRALFTSDTVIGYSGYLNRVAGLLGPAENLSFGMGQEDSRLLEAISLARQGKRVSLVSGGDPGIYGMAAVLGDLLLSRRTEIRGVEVEVIPGIPAHCAAASLLGSPLACDFAVISLSDYLVDRERILARVEACSASDLVIVFYNPASSRRKELLAEASDVILRHRAPNTPVALVRNAWREEKSVRLIYLGELKEAEADMHTVVVVGNSETGLAGGWMATRRGYCGKRNV